MTTLKTNDIIVVSDGLKTKKYVVLGFTKFHVSVAPKAEYDYSISMHGSYCTMRYGFATIPLKNTGARMGFWEMLKEVNGASVGPQS